MAAPGIHLLLALAFSAMAQVPPIGPVNEIAGPAVEPPAIPAPAKPYVYPRSAWDTHPPSAPAADPSPRSRIIIHHTADALSAADMASAPGSPAGETGAKEKLRGMLRLHRGEFKWSDIAYHYVIDWEGRAWTGRPIASVGAHTEGHNRGSIGVAVMGNWDLKPRSEAEAAARKRQLEGLEGFLAWLAWAHKVPPKAILGHREFNSTACPGRYLARTVEDDFEGQKKGEPSSPLREMRLRLVARLGGEPSQTRAADRALAKPVVSRAGNGLAALNAAGAFDRAFDNSGIYGNTFNVPAGDLAAPVLPGTAPRPAPQSAAAPDPASIDDGRYSVPFASQRWPGVRHGGAYGAPRSYGRHTGIDFQAEEGTEVFASRPGRVTFVDTDYTNAYMRTKAGHRGYGNRVIVEHPDGTETWYCHLQPGSVQVKEGDAVSRDTHIGNVGDTGFSHGPHLHFMVISAGGEPRNPALALGHTSTAALYAKRPRAPSTLAN